MLILASSTLDANAVPAVILVGLLILYASVGAWLVSRKSKGGPLPNLAYATIAGVTSGLLAGFLAALSIDYLFFALTGDPLDAASLLDLFLLVAATFGLGVGTGLYVRRAQSADAPTTFIAWRSLQNWTTVFVVILNLLIVFGLQADVAVILSCLVGGLLTSVIVSRSVELAPQEALAVLHHRPNGWLPGVVLAFCGGFIGWSSVGNYYQQHACGGVSGTCQAHLPADALPHQLLGLVIGALIFFLIAQLAHRLHVLFLTLEWRSVDSPIISQRWTQIASGLAALLGLGIATFPLWGPQIGIPIQ